MIQINKIEYSNCTLYSFAKNGVEYYTKEVELDDVADFDGWIKSLFTVLDIKAVLK